MADIVKPIRDPHPRSNQVFFVILAFLVAAIVAWWVSTTLRHRGRAASGSQQLSAEMRAA